MKDLNREIGERLKGIRHIFNDGKKLSAEQFGHLLGESRDNIANYESGRAGLPVRLLYELYFRGVCPTWLITGLGSVFADNDEGKKFNERILLRNVSISNVYKLNENELQKVKVLKVAAGKPKNNEEK